MFCKKILIRSVATQTFNFIRKQFKKQLIRLLTELLPSLGNRLFNQAVFLSAGMHCLSAFDCGTISHSVSAQKILEVLCGSLDLLLLNVYRKKLALVPTTLKER